MSWTGTRCLGTVFARTVTGALLLLVMLMAFSAWGASNADAGTLIVTKGGDRNTSSNSVTGATNYAQNLAGAEFEYSTSATGPWTAIPGTTGANGQVSITLSAGTYFVRERTPAPGFDNFGPVQGLWFGGQLPSASQPYTARVNVTTTGTTYAHPHTNTSSNPSNWTPTNTASGSNNGTPFVDVRNNGTVANGCGQNILLVLDRSGSIEPYKEAYEAAAREFVNQLNGTPTQIGIISFNNNVNSYQPSTGNSNFYQSPLDLSNAGSAATLNGKISNIYDDPTSLTNWDGVLQAAAQAKSFTNNPSTGQTTNPDMVVFITDGNPTTSQVSTSSSNSDLINLTSGIASANLVKNQASRTDRKLKMLAIGVGTGVTADNLKVVSGPVQGVNGDYAVPTIPELQAFLQELAAAQCGARVYVRKHLAGDNTNQAGWKYTAVDPRPGFTPSYLDNNNATHSSGMPPVIQTGAFFTNLPTSPTTVQVNENATGQPLSNFDLTSVVCRKGSYDSGTVVNGTQNGFNFSLPVSRGDEIYCTYTNSPKTTLTINKTPDNATINAGDDAEFTITVQNTGTNTAVSAVVSDQLPAPGVGGWTVSEQPAGGNCSINGANLMSCNLGNVPAGQTRTIKVKTGTNAANCAVYDNPTARASAANASEVTNGGKITCQKPNLSVDKTAASGTISAGDDVQFSVTLTNNGPGVAKGATLSDTLPGGTAGGWTIVSQPAGNPCQINGQNLTCSFGDLSSGQSRTVTVKAPTNATACTTYDNTATGSATNAANATDSATVNCQTAGLGVLKTAVQATINAGDNAQFTIVTSNTGAGTAKDVTLSDPLPTAGISGPWTITNQPGNPCSITAGTLNCDFGDLAAGQSRSVTVQAPTNFENCSQLDNEATASSSNTPDASDDATIHCQKPNLSVVKTASQGTINAGDDAQFTVAVSNSGPGTAKAVTLSDPLPTGTAGAWTIVSQPAGNPCSITAGTLNCAFGDLAAGQTRTVTVKASTSFQSCGTYDNTATASSTNAPNATDSASVNCQKPALTVTKNAAQGTINAGEDAQFSVTLTNNGPGVAKGATLSDPLPTGTAGAWTIVSQPAGNPCSITAGTLNCNFGDLAAGQSRTVTVKAPTSGAMCSTYSNTATGSAGNHPNVSDSATVNCVKPNLTVDKSAASGTINAGEDAQFSITVSNAGPGTATGVSTSDPLPTGTAGAWTIVSQPAGNPCSITAGTLNCAFGDLAAGQTRTVTVKASTSFQACAKYDNTVTMTSTNSPTATDSATIDCKKPSLSVDKTAASGTVNAGEDVQFSVVTSNAGPGTAKAVTLSDPLPGGVLGDWTIVSQPAGNPCSIAAGVLNCDFGDLAAGQSRTVTVKAATGYDSCTTYDNTATASAGNHPDATDSARVSCEKPGLSTLKTAVSGTISAGDDAVFTISVSNTGPGTANGVTLSDPLPTGVSGAWTIVSQPAGDPCSITAGTLNCDFGDLAAGQSRDVTVKAATDFENCTKLDNEATASADNAPDAADNASINCQRPNLTVVKNGNGAVNAGEDVEFTIQVNNAGPGTAKKVTLSDSLPSGVAGAWTISSQPAGDPCAITAGVLDCDFGDMTAGATHEVTVKAATSYEDCTVYDNTATASADNAPDASDSAEVTCNKPGLATLKTAVSATINAGEDAVFTVEVSNTGLGTAKNVTLSDPLPTGVSGPWTITDQPAGDPCSITAGTLNCDFGDLAAGQTRTVTVKAATDFESCTKLDNEATASADNAPDASDDASIDCQKPNLTVEKTAAQGTINAGEDVQFAITATNDGPGVAKDVTISDSLPAGTAGPWTIVSQPAGDPCSIAGGVLECDFGDLSADGSASVTVKAPTSYESCTVYENTVTASASNHPDESDSASVRCDRPSTSTLKTAVTGTINAGDDAEFSITVSNAGPGVAKDVTLSDPLPTGVAGDWTIVSQPAGNPCSITAGTLSCDFGDMAPQASHTVVVRAATDFEDCATLDNTAIASGSNAPDASDSASINCQKPGLQIVKSGNGPVSAGENIEFSITVSNSGAGTAKGVTLTDPLPNNVAGGWTITSQPEGNPCTINGNGRTLTCDFGDMPAGASHTVTVRAATNDNRCGVYDNTATAGATNAPDVTAAARIRCLTPSLQLRKRANRRVVLPGQKVRYTILVRNRRLGSVARNLKVCDRIPPKMTVTRKGRGHFENGRLCWRIPRLQGSRKWTRLHYVAQVSQNANGGDRLRNVVMLKQERATWTVRVKEPPVQARRQRRTPVTG